MRGRELSKALRCGQRVFGTCALSTSPLWPAALESAGIDFVFIDSEHIPMDRDKMAWICGAYSARNVAPVVRIAEPSSYLACMALDGGAHGIVVPYVESAAQVMALRGAVKLRPLKGRRLQEVLDKKELLDEEVASYLAKWNRDSVLIINIESAPALEALDEILAEPGIDALLVGPHDLSINLGIPEQYDHPDFLGAIDTIIRKARAAGVGVGIHFFWGIEQEIAWAKQGANLILHSSDLVILHGALEEDLGRIRGELGEKVEKNKKPESLTL